MNFGTLKSRLLEQIGRAPAAVCYEMVTADINQRLRLTDMEATATVVEAASVALPSDFQEMIAVYRDTDPRKTLTPTTPQALSRCHVTSGIPAEYAVVDGNLLLNPEPNGSENLELRYYAKQADLSADGDTNDILTNFPAVYVYGVLTHHAALVRDVEAASAWATAYGQALTQARTSDLNKKMAGAPMRPVAAGSTP